VRRHFDGVAQLFGFGLAGFIIQNPCFHIVQQINAVNRTGDGHAVHLRMANGQFYAHFFAPALSVLFVIGCQISTTGFQSSLVFYLREMTAQLSHFLFEKRDQLLQFADGACRYACHQGIGFDVFCDD